MIRASSHIHHWGVSAPARGFTVYVVFHVHLMCLYVRKTGDPLIKRLRKHWTTTRAGYEESPFYDMLCKTCIHEWTIVPLQCTTCDVEVCFLERDWWFGWRKWALNACAPAVPTDKSMAPPAAWHTKRFAVVIRQLQVARVDRDYARIPFLQSEASSLAKQLNIAEFSGSIVRVPYMDPMQQKCALTVITDLLKRKRCPRWERQALRASIHVVRTVLLCVLWMATTC